MSRKVYEISTDNKELERGIIRLYGGFIDSPLSDYHNTNKKILHSELSCIANSLKTELSMQGIKHNDLKLKVIYNGLCYCSKCDEYHYSDDYCYCLK